jgi:hypothetical protein
VRRVYKFAKRNTLTLPTNAKVGPTFLCWGWAVFAPAGFQPPARQKRIVRFGSGVLPHSQGKRGREGPNVRGKS